MAEMQKILAEDKQNVLIRFNMSVGLLSGEACKYIKQQIARGFVMLHLANKKGLFKDATSEYL